MNQGSPCPRMNVSRDIYLNYTCPDLPNKGTKCACVNISFGSQFSPLWGENTIPAWGSPMDQRHMDSLCLTPPLAAWVSPSAEGEPASVERRGRGGRQFSEPALVSAHGAGSNDGSYFSGCGQGSAGDPQGNTVSPCERGRPLAQGLFLSHLRSTRKAVAQASRQSN